MKRNAQLIAVALLGVTSVSACATKGYVNRTVNTAAEQERIARAAGDSANSRDVAGVRTEVASVRSDLQALRNDLTALRTEFGARITAMEDQVKFDMPVHFGYDDAAVREQDRAALERFAKVTQKYYPGAKITVEGFADPAGSSRYNLALSKKRADAVKDYLVQQGLNDALLASVGYGKARQVRPGAAKDAPGAELNRRVVFVVEATDVGTITAMANQTPQTPE